MGLRVIGGEYRGKNLISIQGMKTRPTAARLRESLFNILSTQIRGAKVLDLYAGTGALGIEALSRGAESAVFIDNHKTALSVIQKNIRACKLEPRSKIIRWNVLANLNCLKPAVHGFNLVFLDPPYNTGAIKQSMQNLANSSALEKGAQVVIEHSAREGIPVPLSGFDISSQRRYSNTIFTFCNYNP